jgi:hypothetical protein
MIVVAFGAGVAWVLLMLKNARQDLNRHKASGLVAAQFRRSIQDYYTAYRKYPVPDGEGIFEASGGLVDVLQGRNVGGLNSEQKVFLDVQRAADGSPGLQGANSPYFVNDSWGNPFRVEVDSDGDGIVPDPEHPGSSLYQRVIVWSAGKDGLIASWTDNVRTW